jgi:hypothetical protein
VDWIGGKLLAPPTIIYFLPYLYKKEIFEDFLYILFVKLLRRIDMYRKAPVFASLLLSEAPPRGGVAGLRFEPLNYVPCGRQAR